ncbi:MAG: MFS transporter [Caldilineaceae bacterium]|nr:MFS transporter [Caldilineaceae bacterium]HRJ44778.1 MFS transporter [Caldilineaceae bacterium]
MQLSDTESQTLRDFSWNFSVNTADIIFITLGLSLISRETVLPVLISQLTDSKIAIGLLPAIWSLGYYLPQLLTANFTEGLRYKKPFVMLVGGLGERVPYLLIGLAVWFLAESSPLLVLVLLLAGVGIAGASAGIATPAWFDMIAKVIPIQRRGLWSGLGHGLGALLGVAGAYAVGRILDAYAYPQNFATLIFLAFFFVSISWVSLSLTREPPSISTKERIPLIRYLGQLPAVLGRDRNYRRYLISRTVVNLGAMATGFFIVYGRERFALDGAGVGLLTGVLIGSVALLNLVWGVTGDRVGHKAVLTGAALMMAGAPLVALFAPSTGWLVLTFVLLGAGMAGEQASSLNIILEFCAPEDRPTYIGLTNTLLAPVLIVAPIVGGWLATVFGFPALFLVAAVIAGVGALLLALWVREPRQMARNT